MLMIIGYSPVALPEYGNSVEASMWLELMSPGDDNRTHSCSLVVFTFEGSIATEDIITKAFCDIG